MTITLDQRNRLRDHAISARDHAYAPYSNFAVGAALLAEDGQIYQGANIENAAYPQGHCAESSAISAMIMAGQRRIIAAAVIGSSAQPCTPCGGCRQRLREFAANLDIPLFCYDDSAELCLETSLSALLPHSFGPDHLPASPQQN